MIAVSRWIDAYLQRYPQVSVDADFTGRVIDIVHEGFARVEFKNVKEFQDIVINSLLGIIALRKEMGWKDFKAFESWITEQKFSF